MVSWVLVLSVGVVVLSVGVSGCCCQVLVSDSDSLFTKFYNKESVSVSVSVGVAVKCWCQWVVLSSVGVSGCCCQVLVSVGVAVKCWCQWVLMLSVGVVGVGVKCWCYRGVYLGPGGRNPTLAVSVHVDPQRQKPVAYNVQPLDCQLQETRCTCKHLTQMCWVDWRCKRLRAILEPNKVSIPHSHCCTHH